MIACLALASCSSPEVCRPRPPALDPSRISRDEYEDARFAQQTTGFSTRTETTRLFVTVFDEYAWPWRSGPERGCTSVPAHVLEVLLDGKQVAAVEVPCRAGTPAWGGTRLDAYDASPFHVPPGIHRLRVRDRAGGRTTARDYVFPWVRSVHVIDVARVTVFASDDELLVGDLEFDRPGRI